MRTVTEVSLRCEQPFGLDKDDRPLILGQLIPVEACHVDGHIGDFSEGLFPSSA